MCRVSWLVTGNVRAARDWHLAAPTLAHFPGKAMHSGVCRWRWAIAAAFSCGCLAPVAAADPPPARLSVDAAASELFETRVRPLLSARCWECHGKELAESDLRLDSRERLLRGGKRGPAIDLERPEQSRLLIAVQYADPDLSMPPDGQLAADDVKLLADWVAAGAPWPESAAAENDAHDHWAFQPVVKPPIPQGVDRSWCLGPVDHFVAEARQAQGLNASARADRPTLIRRVSFDLTGLPPTAAEIDEFLADRRSEPEAMRDLIERYLASPRYGERWGRHWLDIARFADTAGYKSIEIGLERADFPDAFTYRDWVIEAFNRDLPYDTFLIRQLAADLLPEGQNDLQTQRGLGFLTVGRRDKRDVHEVMDDRIDTVTRGLMGLTVHCARCHDHKTDPIPTEDYYSLYGVFCSVEEPTPFPLLKVEPTPLGREFEEKLAPLKAAVDAFLRERAEEYNRYVRAHAAEIMAAVAEIESSGADVQPTAYRRKIPPRVLARFVRVWRSASQQPDGGRWFSVWNTWRMLPQENIAAGRAALLKRLSSEAEFADPALAAAVISDQPADLGALAACYTRAAQQALAEADKASAGWLVSPQSPFVCSADNVAEALAHAALKQLAALEAPMNELLATHPGAPGRAMVVRERVPAYDAKVFVRGQPENAGAPAPRRFLSLLSGPQRTEYRTGSGRLELARAIVDSANPLTARVLVNYVWLKHFGRGLVPTPNNFGLSGTEPSHPQLLDYLAAEFVERGWSLKQLHRLMLNSAAYAQASANRSPGAVSDPENVWLWKFASRPLDFECLRDAWLAVGGELEGQIGGRSVGPQASGRSMRRTMYLFADRAQFDPVRRLFNVPVPKSTAPDRYQNIVPQQALYMMNNAFVQDRAEAVVRAPEFRAETKPEARVAWLFRRVLGRLPDAAERGLAVEYVKGELAKGMDPSRAWAAVAHGLMMTSEFAFLE